MRPFLSHWTSSQGRTHSSPCAPFRRRFWSLAVAASCCVLWGEAGSRPSLYIEPLGARDERRIGPQTTGGAYAAPQMPTAASKKTIRILDLMMQRVRKAVRKITKIVIKDRGEIALFAHQISTADRTHARTGPDTQRAQAHNHTQNSNSRTHPRQTLRAKKTKQALGCPSHTSRVPMVLFIRVGTEIGTSLRRTTNSVSFQT